MSPHNHPKVGSSAPEGCQRPRFLPSWSSAFPSVLSLSPWSRLAHCRHIHAPAMGKGEKAGRQAFFSGCPRSCTPHIHPHSMRKNTIMWWPFAMHLGNCSLRLGWLWQLQGKGSVAKRTKGRLDVGDSYKIQRCSLEPRAADLSPPPLSPSRVWVCS